MACLIWILGCRISNRCSSTLASVRLHQQKLVFASGEPGALGAWGAQDANLNSGWRVGHVFCPGGNKTGPGATGAAYKRHNTPGCHWRLT